MQLVYKSKCTLTRCASISDHYVKPSLEIVRNLPSSHRHFPFLRPPPLFLGTISYGEFLKDINNGSVEEVTVSDGNKINITFKDGDTEDVIVPDIRSSAIYDKLVEKDVEVNIKENETRAYLSTIGVVLQYAMIFIVGSLFLQMIFARSSSNGPFAFAKSKATLHETNDVKIRFNDVAGLDGAKAELLEVVDFLKNPEKYSVVGGKIPKGCLLVGPPGTGKTLLAKAIAGEAGVPFFSCSASEFIELFSGVGAARVRDMFKNAAQKAPCIIFIDEIDAVGKTRGAHSMLSGNDEREQTINQLLTEMDGFKDNSGVIVIAATNRVEILDPALLRPGRFDRQIIVELPDFQGRTAILGVHTQNKPLDDTVSLESIAKVTTGYSGADLANLANEAAILAARRNKTKIGSSEFNDALEKIVLGLERKPIASEAKRKLVAYHEAGHTLVALKVGTFDSIKKVTILPRGKAGGVTLFEPDPERIDSGLYSREYMYNQIVVALGGRVAEELIFGKDHVTTGASSDIEKVQQIARMMVSMYGFDEEIGPIAWKPSSRFETQFSEMILSKIDNQVQKVVDEAYKRAFDILSTNRATLDVIAEKLIQVETLSGDELTTMLSLTNTQSKP